MRGLKVDAKILCMMWNKMVYFDNHYINPSQKTWQKWVCNQGGLDVSVRTINRYFRAMEKRMLVQRIRRVRHDGRKGMMFLTTLYSIGWLGLHQLRLMGVITMKQLQEYIKHRKPFDLRMTRKVKKGLSPADEGYYIDYTFTGAPRRAPV